MRLPRSRLARWLTAAAVACVLGELGVRVVEALAFDAPVGVLRSYVQHDGDYWTLEPGVRLIQPERDGDTLYEANRLGLRDREPPAASDRRPRILFVGDSITFGLAIAAERGFPRLLEAALSEGREAEVRAVNVSIWGWAPAQQREALARHAEALAPTLIVHQLHMNDFGPARRRLARPTSVAELVRSLPLRFRIVRNLVLDRSALYRRLHQAVFAAGYTRCTPGGGATRRRP